MRLGELASAELSEKGDYEFRYLYGHTPVFNDIFYTSHSEKLKVERFRFSQDSIFSLKIDGEDVPFARTKKKKSIFPNSYEARVEILPCMIPQALEALALYMQTDPVINNNAFSKSDVMPHLREAQAIQRELYNIMESNLLENKPKESYRERKMRKLSFVTETISD